MARQKTEPKAQTPAPESEPNQIEYALTELVAAIQPLAKFAEKTSTSHLPDAEEVDTFPILKVGDWRRLCVAIQNAQVTISKD